MRKKAKVLKFNISAEGKRKYGKCFNIWQKKVMRNLFKTLKVDLNNITDNFYLCSF